MTSLEELLLKIFKSKQINLKISPTKKSNAEKKDMIDQDMMIDLEEEDRMMKIDLEDLEKMIDLEEIENMMKIDLVEDPDNKKIDPEEDQDKMTPIEDQGEILTRGEEKEDLLFNGLRSVRLSQEMKTSILSPRYISFY